MTHWVQAVREGNRRALAQMLTHIENGGERAHEALAALYPHAGHAHRIGVTGGAGTGKSTLVNALARALRQRGRTVGIVTVDPSSPFTGGALLGDRVRMRDLAGDPGVFIRSMASRGQLGGLAGATADVVTALDAAGFEVIVIETAGVGQGEVDIARAAHTTLVVEAPGLGDGVQAIKAGVLEIADILVLNKADLPGAAQAAGALQSALEPGADGLRTAGWMPPLVQTVATEGKGIDALLDAIDAHNAHLAQGGQFAVRERLRVEAEITRRLRDALLARVLDDIGAAEFEAAVGRVLAREEDPHAAVRRLLDGLSTPTPPGDGR